MHAKDAIRHTIGSADFTITSYLKDLDDADFRMVPVAGMHPIALQIGHLIESGRMMTEGVKEGASPKLPAGFAEAHSIKEPKPAGYVSKDEYLKLWADQIAATRAVLDSATDADLDAPGPEAWREYVPTMGAMLNMVGLHALMHAGQFVAVRRKLGKPIAF